MGAEHYREYVASVTAQVMAAEAANSESLEFERLREAAGAVNAISSEFGRELGTLTCILRTQKLT